MPYKKDFTPVTGIEPAIRRFRRNSPQIGLNTIHFHILHPITPASEHLPSNVKFQQLRKHNPIKASQDRIMCLEKPSFAI